MNLLDLSGPLEVLNNALHNKSDPGQSRLLPRPISKQAARLIV
jgi:hypothetical protein